MVFLLSAIVSLLMATQPTFTTADQAVEFLASQLRAGHFDSLRAAFRAPSDKSTFEFLAKRLQALDRKTPLPALYANRPFPTTSNTFTLGGHGIPWDHLHVRFVKVEDHWVLQSLTQCR